jgi:hypothetical protein
VSLDFRGQLGVPVNLGSKAHKVYRDPKARLAVPAQMAVKEPLEVWETLAVLVQPVPLVTLGLWDLRAVMAFLEPLDSPVCQDSLARLDHPESREVRAAPDQPDQMDRLESWDSQVCY